MVSPDGPTHQHPYQLHQDERQLENPLSTLTGSHGDDNETTGDPQDTTTRQPSAEKENGLLEAHDAEGHDSDARQDVVVICKHYYVSHSLRYPALLHAGRPAALNNSISSDVWHDLQSQLGPLLKHHLFLPRSYLFVPILCLVSTMGWFLCFSIATSQHFRQQQQEQDATVSFTMSPFQQFLWAALFFSLMTAVWWAFRRWVQRRNAPADEELQNVCAEWSRHSRLQGYRLEYYKANTSYNKSAAPRQKSKGFGWETLRALATESYQDDVFATRVLRFVPLPVPRKIIMVVQQPSPTGTTTAYPSTSLSNSNSLGSHNQENPTTMEMGGDSAPKLPALPPTNTMTNTLFVGDEEEASMYSSLHNTPTEFYPFPASDRILENLLSLLFVLVIFQCIHSLP